MIALLRSTDGNPDSRFEKYISFLNRVNVPHITICWDRFGVKNKSSRNLYYKKRAKYGLGLKNLPKLLGFNFFLIRSLYKSRKQYQIIHAADFDTIIPAILMKFFFGKRVIYDIYDWFIDSREIKSSVFKSFILFFERICVTRSDIVILCEEGRMKQIKFTPRKFWILPNIPYFDDNSFNIIKEYKDISKPLIISYVGILGTNRGLENLVVLAQSHPEIKIAVGGFGELETIFNQISNLPNVTFYGRVSYKQALSIMSKSDLIYAVYSPSNPNHIYAAPNKYYEGLALGIPIITSTGTLVGNKVKEFNTGYCIDDRYSSLEHLLVSFNIKEYNIKKTNSIQLWGEKYRDYVKNFLQDTYHNFLIES